MGVPAWRAWARASGVGVVATAAGMAASLFVLPALSPKAFPYWSAPPDAWLTLQAAHLVAWGGLPLIYEAGNRGGGALFVSGPILPILMAPVAMLSAHFGWSEAYPLFVPRPSAWPVYGAAGLFVCSVPLFLSMRSLRRAVGGMKVPLWALELAAAVLVLLPTAVLYGHYEDVLALALVAAALARLPAVWEGAPPSLGASPALMLALAVLCKQWAALAIPVLVAVLPRGRRLRGLAVAAGLPAVVFGFFLAVDWRFASVALLHPPSFPRLRHAALWVSPGASSVVGTPSRLVAFVLAGAVAWWLWDRRDLVVVVTGFALVLLARGLFEPVAFSYYFGPGIALFLVGATASRGRAGWVFGAGTALLAWFLVYPPRPIWWVGLGLLCLATAGPAMVDVLAIRPMPRASDAWGFLGRSGMKIRRRSA